MTAAAWNAATSAASWTRTTLISIGEQTKDPDKLYNLAQFSHYIMKAAKYRNEAIGMRLGAFFSVFDAFEMFPSLYHFASGKAGWDSATGATAAVAIATIAGTAEWLGELGVTPKVVCINLCKTACSAVAIAYIFSFNTALNDYTAAQSAVKVREAKAHLISSGANIALYTLMAVSTVSLPTIVAVGFIAKGVDVGRFIYRARHAEEFKKG